MDGLVGFQNSERSGISLFDADQTGSTSGTYYTEESGITPSLMTFAKPPDHATLADYARAVNRAAIRDTLQEYINNHKQLTRARTLLETVTPVSGVTRFTDQLTKSGRLVGIMLRPSASDTLAAVVQYIGVQFNTANPGLTLYIYETSQNEPIGSFALTGHDKALSLQWFTREVICKYRGNTSGTGQKFLIGYFENELSGNALNTKLTSACCGNERWVNAYRSQVYVSGFSIPGSQFTGTTMLDNTQIGETDTTFGLHVRFYTTCEITDVICDNSLMFAMMIRKRGAMRIFRDYFNGTNVNREQDMSRDRAVTNYEMVKQEYDQLIKSQQFDLTNIDRKCMPCSQRDIRTATLA